jgi:hypothetical protein
VWLTLHEPRAFTALIVAAYVALFVTGLGAVAMDRAIMLPEGVYSARMASGLAFMFGTAITAPSAWRGIWWAERIGIPFLAFGMLARIFAVVSMGDARDTGTVVFAVGAWVGFCLMVLARGVWVKISPYRLGAGPLLPEMEATLARARLENDEPDDRD